MPFGPKPVGWQQGRRINYNYVKGLYRSELARLTSSEMASFGGLFDFEAEAWRNRPMSRLDDGP